MEDVAVPRELQTSGDWLVRDSRGAVIILGAWRRARTQSVRSMCQPHHYVKRSPPTQGKRSKPNSALLGPSATSLYTETLEETYSWYSDQASPWERRVGSKVTPKQICPLLKLPEPVSVNFGGRKRSLQMWPEVKDLHVRSSWILRADSESDDRCSFFFFFHLFLLVGG